MLWDYIVVGGGLAGSVVSNRLLGLNTSLNILVIDAGPNANDRQDIVWPNGTGGADLRWSVPTAPQVNLNNRTLDIFLGTGLGGGTLINAGNWVRGDKADYDEWGATVGDDRWSYAGQLPFMRQSEAFQHPDRNPEQHGYTGKVFAQTVTSTNRPFPLRKYVLQSWNEIGVPILPGLDGNAGNPLGVGDFSENKYNGRREIASVIYPLDGITVLADTLVEKVLVSTNGTIHASGVQLANGTQILSRRVILSAGALRTPQILMLSGIGPRDELERHGIDVKVESPEVGKNFMEHSSSTTSWAIRNPEEGWIPGSGNPLFDQEQYGWGNPQDFMVSTSVDASGLAAAIEADEGVAPDPSTHRLLQQNRTLLEHVFQYFSYGGGASGSTVSFMSILFLPTSRGTVTLASTNASDFPVVDPNYFGTNVDQYVHREAQRLQYRFAGSNTTVLGREILGGEVISEGQDALAEGITDDALNNRLRASVRSAFHPSGTASMGKVVDNDLKVKGVDNLFVVDTSVFPVPIAAHLQVATYALAEQAATIISQA
ncbi:alcohol dehydrogenase [Colletotrichum sp. SAR 10_76]|nr:alcohol dehydrogenase [Colletotrichum sp. SAR 10_76]